MDPNKFDLLTDYTSAGYALAKDLQNGRICVMEGDCAIYTTEYEDLWYEYPQGTQCRTDYNRFGRCRLLVVGAQ